MAKAYSYDLRQKVIDATQLDNEEEQSDPGVSP
jgi:hypothetical protein